MFKIFDKNSGRTTNGRPVHAELRVWYVGHQDRWWPDRSFEVFYGSEEEDLAKLPWQIKEVWDDVSVISGKMNRCPQLLRLLDSYERCEERRRLAAAKAKAEEEAKLAAEAAAKEAEETAAHGPIAGRGYYLRQCSHGLFEGCESIGAEDYHYLCKVRVDEALKNFKVVRGRNGVLYARKKGVPFYAVTEEEAYDILCGNHDMSYA